MSELWPPGELERKNALLSPGEPLAPKEIALVQSAECILTQETIQGLPAGFTQSEVGRCTGLQPRMIGKTLARLVRARLAIRLQAGVFLGDPGATLYLPMPLASGESFFRPTTRPGCERTAQQALVADMWPSERRTFHCLAQLIATAEKSGGDKPTVAAVAACSGLKITEVGEVCEQFEYRGIVDTLRPPAQPAAEGGHPQPGHDLTEHGRWLVAGLSQTSCPGPIVDGVGNTMNATQPQE